MGWTEINTEELAHRLGVDSNEIAEKQSLIKSIVHARKKQGLSQVELAKRLGVTQGRIAQIESGVGTRKLTFDVLLHTLKALGIEFHIVARQRSRRSLKSEHDTLKQAVA
jgi:transcriptional regulator with XRE-family HTH domain